MDRNSKCKYNGDALAYLYNELASAEMLQFEDHLANCHLCTDEFAGIADARLAVYEWNSLEFANIATPDFHLPQIEQASEAKASWIEGIKSIFSPKFNWAAATTGFAGLIIVGVIGLMLLNMGGNDHISSIALPDQPDAEDVFKSLESNENEDIEDKIELSAPQEIITDDRTDFEYINAAEDISRPIRRPARNIQRPSVQRISTVIDNMPTRLSNFEETQDDSLRLSELFDDSGIS